MYSIESITVKNLDEYKGIVAGLIDEIGIVELINQKCSYNTTSEFTCSMSICHCT